MKRGVLVQRPMGPRLIIVGSICAYDSAQVRFTKHDHVVHAFPADRADEPLDICILPRWSGCDRSIPNARGARTPHEDWSVRGVPIPAEVSRRMVSQESLGDLARSTPIIGAHCRLPQHRVFRFQRCSRFEARSQDTEISLSRSVIRPRAYPVCSLCLRRIESSVHSTSIGECG